MDQEEINRVADAVVTATFLKLGVDISTPEAVTKMQADFAFMRRNRLAGEALKQNALRTLWYLLGVGLVGLMGWLAASLSWKPHP